MKSGVLWNEVMTALHKREYADVKIEHQLADALGMQLVRWPKQFDVIVTDNLFGDMSVRCRGDVDRLAGMLPFASLGDADPKNLRRKALYETVHGSAPDIAGKGVGNPIAMIGSFGMVLAIVWTSCGRRSARHGHRQRARDRVSKPPTSAAARRRSCDNRNGRCDWGGTGATGLRKRHRRRKLAGRPL